MLTAFVECNRDCVGQEIDWPDQKGVDQEWYSESESRRWRFSAFAYEFISYSPQFPEWADASFPKELTEQERTLLDRFERFDRLMRECEAAAARDDNQPILEMAGQVREMYRLWGEAIRYRVGEIR
jgi:hypothetical protein